MTTGKNETLENMLERLYGKLCIGDVLKSHRKSDGISLSKMAEKLEIDKEKLKKIENNHLIPSLAVVKKASKRLNLNLKVLEGLLEQSKKSSGIITYLAMNIEDINTKKIQALLKNPSKIPTVALALKKKQATKKL